MNDKKILDDIASLPPQGQRQIKNFILFLKKYYAEKIDEDSNKKKNLLNESFIGMWKDRKETRDSVSWVRDLRKREWGNTHE